MVTFLKVEGNESKEVEVEYLTTKNHAQNVGTKWVTENPGWNWHGRYATKINGKSSVIFVQRNVQAIAPAKPQMKKENDEKVDPGSKKIEIHP